MDDKDGLIGASWMTEAPDDGSMGMAIIQGLQARENEMKRDNKAIVRGFADEVITQGKIEAAGQYVWEDVVEQVPFPGQGPGIEGLKDVLLGMRTAFPDL